MVDAGGFYRYGFSKLIPTFDGGKRMDLAISSSPE